MSHHRHHCLFSSFYFSRSELSFCGSHRYKGVSPTRVRPHLSIKPMQAPPSLAVQRHLRRHSFGSLAHAERGGEALLPDSAARRHCYAARYLHRLGRRRGKRGYRLTRRERRAAGTRAHAALPPTARRNSRIGKQTRAKTRKAHGRRAASGTSRGRQNATSSRSARLYLRKVKQRAGRSPPRPSSPARGRTVRRHRALPARSPAPTAAGRGTDGAGLGAGRGGGSAAGRANRGALRGRRHRETALPRRQQQRQKNANKRKHSKKEL